MIPERVLAPFAEASFRNGLVIGVVALVIGAAVAAAWRSRTGRPCPLAGLLVAGGGAVAVLEAGVSVQGLVPGLVALGIGGCIVDVVPRLRPALPLLALPGAWLLATGIDVSQSWAPLAVGIVVAGGGALAADFDARWSARPLGPGLLVASLGGVFLTVPETAEALPVLGAALPLALIGWPGNLASLGAGGSLAATGLLAWTVAQGGTFRDTAIVGGLACLGMLVAEPLGRMARTNRHGRRLPRPVGVLVAVVAAHLVVVLLASRVAGLGDDLVASLGIAGLALAAGAAASLAIRAVAARPRPTTEPGGTV
ncbi:MAG: hypothetical protein KY450_01490 [Actinobacteria bacterium]|nr:hypothetical protein [Actinomycetota bacterium]